MDRNQLWIFFKVHNNCAIINHCHHHRGFHDDDDDFQEGGLMGLHYTSVNATLGNITTTTTTSKTVLEDIEGVRNLKYLWNIYIVAQNIIIESQNLKVMVSSLSWLLLGLKTNQN